MKKHAPAAVMASKRSAADTAALEERDPRAGLQYFPTPPWATRAFLAAAGIELAGARVWEPMCGSGHMAAVLEEAGASVYASDIYPHGYGDVGSFVGGGLDANVLPRPWPETGDWVITNPAFSLAVATIERGLMVAENIAILARTQWLETPEREQLFARYRFEVWVYADRVPMAEFAWKPSGSTATSYAWFVLRKGRMDMTDGTARFDGHIIPSGARRAFTRPDDARRFAGDPPAILAERRGR